MDMTAEEAKRLDEFNCHNCLTEDQKKLHDSHVSSRNADMKVNSGALSLQHMFCVQFLRFKTRFRKKNSKITKNKSIMT